MAGKISARLDGSGTGEGLGPSIQYPVTASGPVRSFPIVPDQAYSDPRTINPVCSSITSKVPDIVPSELKARETG